MIPTQGGHQLFLSESGLTIYGRQNWPKMFAYLEPGSVRTNAFSKWFKSPCQQICVSYNWLNLLIMWLKHFCLCNHCLTTRCPEVLEWMLPITGDLEECSGIHPLYVQGYTLIKSYASATNIKWTRVVISQRKMVTIDNTELLYFPEKDGYQLILAKWAFLDLMWSTS